jgi:hydroxyacylglutathione hydrolase
VGPENDALKQRMAEVEKLRAAGEATLPTTIALEKKTNPFFRANDAAIQKTLDMTGAAPADVFAELRERKNKG